MNISIKNNQRKQRLTTTSIRKRLSALLTSIGLHGVELSVLFIAEHAMRTLNRTWRGKDKTTDVLSFSMREGKFPHIQPEMLGDIVICVPVASQQASERGHSLAREIDRLLIHGLVHLLGYDHERGSQEARRMERKEQQLLKKFSS